MVNVNESNIQQMLDMGYKQNHPDKTRKDTFELNRKDLTTNNYGGN